MTFEDLESWQEARQLTKQGQLLGGLIRSTESRKSKIAMFLSPIFHLPSSISGVTIFHLLSPT